MDTEIALSTVLSTTTTNADAFVLNLIQAGTGSWNRVGRKVHLQSVRLRGIATFAYGTTNDATSQGMDGNLMRMVVVWDKQPSSGVIPTFDTIFGRTTAFGTEACQILDPIRYDNMDRFTVLRDKVLDYQPGAGLNPPTGIQAIVYAPYAFDEYIRLPNLETVFSGQSVPMTLADISTGALYVYFRALVNGSSSASDFGHCEIDASSFARLRYTD